MNISKISLKDETKCFGCGACIAICPRNAITKTKTVLGSWIPEINPDVCINCGLCTKVCENSSAYEDFNKKAYIAYNKNQWMRKQSASGGVFSAIATYILDCGGSVFGAELTFKDGRAIVEHNIVNQSLLISNRLDDLFGQLKDFILQYQFKTEEEEILFFKEIKPRIHCKLIYYRKIYNI